MSYISIDNLNYDYTIYKKKSGISGIFKDFFKREYQTKNVLNNINFNIEKGEKVGLLGPNGAGKSTLIKLLTGILDNKHGNILVDGIQPDTDNKLFLKKIGVVMGQKSQLNWNLPARDTFQVLKAIYEIPSEIYLHRLNEYVDMFNLNHVIDIPVRKLSLGERTKLELIAALLHGPELLILDEPTIGMDIVSQRALYDFVNKVNKEKNVTVLIISHQMIDIESITEKVVILLDGKIKFNGKITDLKNTVNIPKPDIVIEKATKNPLLEYNDISIKEDKGKLVINNYSEKSTILLKVEDIRNIISQNSSFEDAIYKLFNHDK